MILILVMSAQREPWGDLMQCSKETWDSVEHPQTITLYYCGKCIGDPQPRTIYSLRDEHLGNLTLRTLEALMTSLSVPGWTHMARVNSSCYVHKESLVQHISGLPDTGVLEGLKCIEPDGHPMLWGGGQYVMSRDVVEKIVAQSDFFLQPIMDDQAISRAATAAGVQFSDGCMASVNKLARHPPLWLCLGYGMDQQFEFEDFADMKKTAGQYFYRLKQDHDRSLDLLAMRELHKNL